MIRMLSLIAAIAAIGTIDGSETASASPMDANRVSLADARIAPSYVALLPAYVRVRVPACHGGALPSDTSAYGPMGQAIGAQHRTPSGAHVWATRTGYVARYGRTFVNRGRSSVLVAIWCEDGPTAA